MAFFPLFPQVVLFWPLIDAYINEQLPKSHKMAYKAYRYDIFQKRSVGCQYAFQSAKEVPVRPTGP